MRPAPASSTSCSLANSRRRRSWLPALLPAALAGLFGCAPRIPLPPEATHEGDTPIVVPYPPPPAQVEMIGPPPDDAAVWVDGYWLWTGSAWAWTGGEWAHPPEGARYAPPTAVRQRNGELLYYAASWHGPAPAAGSPTTPRTQP